jgi:hypothetical protein
MRGDFDAALRDYDKAVALDPVRRPSPTVAMSMQKGDRQRAIAEYRAARAIEPGNGVALSGLQKLGARP